MSVESKIENLRPKFTKKNLVRVGLGGAVAAGALVGAKTLGSQVSAEELTTDSLGTAEVTPVPTARFDFSFMKRPEPGGELEPFDGTIVDSEGGSEWRMVEEDYELVGPYPGTFDGWVDMESIPEDEREEGVRWGLWSNGEGRGGVRFVRVEEEESVTEEEKPAKTIEELAQEVVCINPTGECVSEGFLIGTNIMNAGVSAISTGEIKRVEFNKPETDESLATVDVAQFVTRDRNGKARIFYVVVQLIPAGNPDFNAYSYITNYLAETYKYGNETSTPYTQEELQKILEKRKQFDFGFSTINVFSTPSDWPPSDILSQIYQDALYVEALQNFLKSGGVVLPEDEFYIFPTEVGSTLAPIVNS